MFELQKAGGLEQFHLLICDNKDHEDQRIRDILGNPAADSHVTFAGHRNEIPYLLRSSFEGIIASTGWDSFTMSVVEIMASGLPLIVSERQELKDIVEEGVCSYPIGSHEYEIFFPLRQRYSNNRRLHKSHSLPVSNAWAADHFSEHVQIEKPPFALANDDFFCNKKRSNSEARQ